MVITKAEAGSTSTKKKERESATDVNRRPTESMAAEITPRKLAPSSAGSGILLEIGEVEGEAAAAGNLGLRG